MTEVDFEGVFILFKNNPSMLEIVLEQYDQLIQRRWRLSTESFSEEVHDLVTATTLKSGLGPLQRLPAACCYFPLWVSTPRLSQWIPAC